MFEPLAPGTSANAIHSIGLGLFIARAIVTAHGLEIRVSSAEDDAAGEAMAYR